MTGDCAFEDCAGRNVPLRMGYCYRHYYRLWSQGDPRVGARPLLTPAETVALRSSPDSNGCWIWSGRMDRDGYGRLDVAGRNVLAHRLSYEASVGPIPGDLTLDHLCRVTACVNPAHLEPVSRGENTMRGDTIPARYAARTHCNYGHPFDAANTAYPKRGGRACKTCRRQRSGRRAA